MEPYDTNSRLRFLDYNDLSVAAQAPFSREDLDSEMHVRTPDGTWLKGFEAWQVLLLRPAETGLARTPRQHASHALDGALRVRIYRPAPLQPSRRSRALRERHLRDSGASRQVTRAAWARDNIFAP